MISVTGRKTASSLSCIICPSVKNFCLRKFCLRKKSLSYQLPLIKSKWWHTYKIKYFIISVFQRISEHDTKAYHNKALEKAKNFVMTFQDPT